MTKMALSWSFKFMNSRKTTSLIPRNTIPVATSYNWEITTPSVENVCISLADLYWATCDAWHLFLSPMWRQLPVFRVTPQAYHLHLEQLGLTGRWVPYPKPHDSSFSFSLKPSHSETFPPPPPPPALASGLPTRAQETLEAHLSLPLWGPLCHRQSWLPAAPTPKPFVNVAEQLTAAWCLCPAASP